MATGKGRIEFENDFTGIYNDVVWGTGTLVNGGFGGGIAFTSVNEGSFASTVDEEGGILAITTDTADNDNACLFAGPFKPANGQMVGEARIKYSNVDTSVFVGFTETLALDTPVMPAEFATATMTYNGTGGMVGMQYDVDGTTDDWRACMGDAGAASGGSGNGTRANATVTADRWAIVRVILNQDGSAECWLGDIGHVATGGNTNYPAMRLIKRFTAGLTPADLFYFCVFAENRSANARVLEVDYMEGYGFRDWNPA